MSLGPYENPFASPKTETPHPGAAEQGDQFPAERSTRFVGNLVDGLLYAAVAIPGALIAVAASTVNDESANEALIVIALFLPMLALLVYQTFLVATTGQTLAKKWLKMRIVRLTGEPAGFLYGVLLRSWLFTVGNYVIPFLGLIDALWIFGEEKRCLHDLVAGTKVIDVSQKFRVD